MLAIAVELLCRFEWLEEYLNYMDACTIQHKRIALWSFSGKGRLVLAPPDSDHLPLPWPANYSIEFPTVLYKDLSAPCFSLVHVMADSVMKYLKPRLRLHNPVTNRMHCKEGFAVIITTKPARLNSFIHLSARNQLITRVQIFKGNTLGGSLCIYFLNVLLKLPTTISSFSCVISC